MFVPSQIFSAFFHIAYAVADTSACVVAYAVTYAVAYDFFSIDVFFMSYPAARTEGLFSLVICRTLQPWLQFCRAKK